MNQNTPVGLEDRFLEVKHTDSKMSKLTVNPCTGRVTLKISKDASDSECYLKEIANIAMTTEFLPFTHRGIIELNRDNTYQVAMFIGKRMKIDSNVVRIRSSIIN